MMNNFLKKKKNYQGKTNGRVCFCEALTEGQMPIVQEVFCEFFGIIVFTLVNLLIHSDFAKVTSQEITRHLSMFLFEWLLKKSSGIE